MAEGLLLWLSQRKTGWDESDHPRRPDGKFGDKAGPSAKPLTGKAAHNSIQRPSEIAGATEDETDAVIRYQSYAHGSINSELRDRPRDPKMQKAARDLQSLINKSEPLKEPIRVVRGISFGDRFLGPVGSRNGQTFTDRGFVSTTSNPRVLRDRFGGETKMSITVPAGMRAIRMMMDEVEGLDEQEVLLPAGTTFKVKSDRMVGGVRNLSLEVTETPTDKVPDPPNKKITATPVPAPKPPASVPTPAPTGNPRLDALNKSLAAYQARLESDEPEPMKAAYKAKIAQIKAMIKKEKSGGVH